MRLLMVWIALVIALPAHADDVTLKNRWDLRGFYHSVGATMTDSVPGNSVALNLLSENSVTLDLSDIPSGADLVAAYLYWSGAREVPDTSVKLRVPGSSDWLGITAQESDCYTDLDNRTNSLSKRFYACRADVTTQVEKAPNWAQGDYFVQGVHSVILPNNKFDCTSDTQCYQAANNALAGTKVLTSCIEGENNTVCKCENAKCTFEQNTIGHASFSLVFVYADNNQPQIRTIFLYDGMEAFIQNTVSFKLEDVLTMEPPQGQFNVGQLTYYIVEGDNNNVATHPSASCDQTKKQDNPGERVQLAWGTVDDDGISVYDLPTELTNAANTVCDDPFNGTTGAGVDIETYDLDVPPGKTVARLDVSSPGLDSVNDYYPQEQCDDGNSTTCGAGHVCGCVEGETKNCFKWRCVDDWAEDGIGVAFVVLGFDSFVPELINPQKTFAVIDKSPEGQLDGKTSPGDVVQYVVTVTNSSEASADASGFKVVDELPIGLRFVGWNGVSGKAQVTFTGLANSSNKDGLYEASLEVVDVLNDLGESTGVTQDIVTIEFPDSVPLAIGESVQVAFQTLIDPGHPWADSGASLTNTVRLEATGIDAELATAQAVVIVLVDTDGDDIKDHEDNCPLAPTNEQTDTDGDGKGDVCDEDIDNDGVPNAPDLCEYAVNYKYPCVTEQPPSCTSYCELSTLHCVGSNAINFADKECLDFCNEKTTEMASIGTNAVEAILSCPVRQMDVVADLTKGVWAKATATTVDILTERCLKANIFLVDEDPKDCGPTNNGATCENYCLQIEKCGFDFDDTETANTEESCLDICTVKAQVFGNIVPCALNQLNIAAAEIDAIEEAAAIEAATLPAVPDLCAKANLNSDNINDFLKNPDPDNDNVRSDEEESEETDPCDDDSDDDGLEDGIELNEYNSDPTECDTDGDGLPDGLEAGITKDTRPDDTDITPVEGQCSFISDYDPQTVTDPTKADTDGGGVPDGEEDVNKDGLYDPFATGKNEQGVDLRELDPNNPFDDFKVSGGSRLINCQSNGRASWIPVVLLLALLGGLMLWRRRASALLLLLVGFMAFPTSSQAQEEVNYNTFRFVGNSKGIIVTEAGELEPPMDYSIGLAATYGHRPLVLRDAKTGKPLDKDFLEQRMGVDLNFAMSFATWFETDINIPMIPFQKGNDPLTGKSVPTFAMGDITLTPKLRIAGSRRGGGFLSLLLPVTFPSGKATKGSYAQGEGFSFRPTIAMSAGEAVVWAMNLGTVIREPGEPLDQVQGYEFFFSMGFEFAFIENTSFLMIDGYGATQFNDFFKRQETTPVEVLLAYKHRFRKFYVTVGGGTGLTRGNGVPEWRLLMNFGYASELLDKDGDRIGDDDDQCPSDPEDYDRFEDLDGCPEPDNDEDGILDRKDNCPNKPEDMDGFEDADGCPEPDNDEDGIMDVDDECPLQPEDKDEFKDEDGCPEPDNDEDGILDPADKCPMEPEDLDGWQDQDGCPDPDNDNDRILDPNDKCPNEPENYNEYKDEDGCPDVVFTCKEFIIPEKVFFRTRSYRMKKKSHPLLNVVAETIMAHPEAAKMEIQGHTDIRGSRRFNQRLSERRAQMVVKYLIKQGVPPDRLTFKGYGFDAPLEPGKTSKEFWNQNRRVQFIVVDLDPTKSERCRR